MVEPVIKTLTKNIAVNNNADATLQLKKILQDSSLRLLQSSVYLKYVCTALEKCPGSIDVLLDIVDLLLARSATIDIEDVRALLLNDHSVFLSLLHNKKYRKKVIEIVIRFLNACNDLDSQSAVLNLSSLNCSEIIYTALNNLRRLLNKDEYELPCDKYGLILRFGLHYGMVYEQTNIPPCPTFDVQHLLTFLPPVSATKKIDKKKAAVHKTVEEILENEIELPPSGDVQWDTSRLVQSSVRGAALSLLFAFIKKTDPSVLLRYWSYLVFPGSPSLRYCIRTDSSWRVRITALSCLSLLLSRSRPFLAHAENPRSAITAFTTFSETLGMTINKLHEDLTQLLHNSSVPVVLQALRCLSNLVQCTPYNRLSKNLITNLVTAVRPLLEHTNQEIQTETLYVLICIMSAEGTTIDASQVEVIFATTIDNLGNTSISIQTKISSLQLLTTFCKERFDVVNSRIMDVARTLEHALTDQNNEIKMQGLRVLEAFSEAMMEHVNNGDDNSVANIERRSEFWCVFLDGPLISLLNEEQAGLRTVACDCLGNVDVQAFQNFTRKYQTLIITQLISSCLDPEPTVRGAALRALSRSVLEASRRDDPGMVADVAQRFVGALCGDDSVTVRIKAAWALSNLTDAMLLNRNESVDEDLPEKLFIDIFEAAVKAASDNDKVKCNILRALGNILHLTTADQLGNVQLTDIVNRAIKALIKTATTGRDMKIKWNSCYAIGNMLKNENLYTLQMICDGTVFTALTNLSMCCNNFKVRTNAVLALSAPPRRHYYGVHWISIWNTLLKVLDQSQNIANFKEYEHCNMLADQTCLTLAHLLSLSELDDLGSIRESLEANHELFRDRVLRCYDRLVPEKTQCFTAAVDRIDALTETSNVMSVDKEISRVIHEVFSIFK